MNWLKSKIADFKLYLIKRKAKKEIKENQEAAEMVNAVFGAALIGGFAYLLYKAFAEKKETDSKPESGENTP